MRWIAFVHVEGRSPDTERDDADVAAMGKDTIESRCMAAPGETSDGQLAAAEDQLGTAVVQVAQGLLALGSSVQ